MAPKKSTDRKPKNTESAPARKKLVLTKLTLKDLGASGRAARGVRGGASSVQSRNCDTGSISTI